VVIEPEHQQHAGVVLGVGEAQAVARYEIVAILDRKNAVTGRLQNASTNRAPFRTDSTPATWLGTCPEILSGHRRCRIERAA